MVEPPEFSEGNGLDHIEAFLLPVIEVEANFLRRLPAKQFPTRITQPEKAGTIRRTEARDHLARPSVGHASKLPDPAWTRLFQNRKKTRILRGDIAANIRTIPTDMHDHQRSSNGFVAVEF